MFIEYSVLIFFLLINLCIPENKGFKKEFVLLSASHLCMSVKNIAATVYDVLAHISVHDVVALNTYSFKEVPW